MNFELALKEKIAEALLKLYDVTVPIDSIAFQETRKEFEGDFTLVVFPFIKQSKKSPEVTANEIGEYVKSNSELLSGFNVVKGFLNLCIADNYWMEYFIEHGLKGNYNITIPQNEDGNKTVMVEYSSPNTNKPLHLGHIRNNLLGYSVAEILKKVGKTVIKANLINDRGIHICKSMLAWQRWGHGETPLSSRMKGDHLVGKYYVLFDKWSRDFSNELIRKIAKSIHPLTNSPEYLKDTFEFAKKVSIWNAFVNYDVNTDYNKLDDNLKDNSERWFLELKRSILNELQRTDISENTKVKYREVLSLIENEYPEIPLVNAKEMLRKWEDGDMEVIALWTKMNGWVYEGFDDTYKKMGVDFDKLYYESETYLLGKEIIIEGLNQGVFYKKPDGSVWVDLTDEGLDEKLLLRSDGTSVYISQDLGTADLRFKDYPELNQLIYVVGNEQEYHFKVLKLIFKKLGKPWYDGLYHLSYGMVNLPSGKMKSREGTVVDADELIDEMVQTAREMTLMLGKVEDFSKDEAEQLFRKLGLGALKYYILKVDAKKTMLFDPAESIDFNGNTGPFIQYTYARICSVIRKAEGIDLLKNFKNKSIDLDRNLLPKERDIIKILYQFPIVIQIAANNYSPSGIAQYAYDLAKTFNTFYHDNPIADGENVNTSIFRLQLSFLTSEIIKESMRLLGIEVPVKM